MSPRFAAALGLALGLALAAASRDLGIATRGADLAALCVVGATGLRRWFLRLVEDEPDIV